MPAQIDIDKIASVNSKIDLDELKRGEDALKRLQKSGTVKRSNYDLGTPESKKYIRPTTEEYRKDCLPHFRKLR
jgi:hypothetical protein